MGKLTSASSALRADIWEVVLWKQRVDLFFWPTRITIVILVKVNLYFTGHRPEFLKAHISNISLEEIAKCEPEYKKEVEGAPGTLEECVNSFKQIHKRKPRGKGKKNKPQPMKKNELLHSVSY